MITIEYTPEGAPVPDFEFDVDLELITQAIEEGRDSRFRYSTSNIFEMVMLWVAQEKLDWTAIEFEFDGETIHIERDGHLESTPEGFLFDIAAIKEKHLELSFALRRRMREEAA